MCDTGSRLFTRVHVQDNNNNNNNNNNNILTYLVRIMSYIM